MDISKSAIFELLQEVKDPEIPVISIIELGIVRDAVKEGDTWRIDITPTYSGCPAMREIEEGIAACLRGKGISSFRINMVYSPAWTTDWIPEEARQKLKAYGIAPPGKAEESALVEFPKKRMPLPCPYCSSVKTELKSEFGSTACKSLHFCSACQQPFEHFKAF